MEKLLNTDALFNEIKEKALSYSKNFNTEKLEKAYLLAKEAHEGQNRNSGEAYLYHPLSVAKILAEYELDCDTLVGALLHDVVEDTSFTLDDIKEKFGANVADIVDGVTKLAKIKYNSKEYCNHYFKNGKLHICSGTYNQYVYELLHRFVLKAAIYADCL